MFSSWSLEQHKLIQQRLMTKCKYFKSTNTDTHMLIILFNLIIILAFANTCSVDDDPENKWTWEWKEIEDNGVQVEKGDDDWWHMNTIRLNIKQGGSSLPN